MQGSERQKPPLHPSREGSRLQTAPAPRRAVYRAGRRVEEAGVFMCESMGGSTAEGPGAVGFRAAELGRIPFAARR